MPQATHVNILPRGIKNRRTNVRRSSEVCDSIAFSSFEVCEVCFPFLYQHEDWLDLHADIPCAPDDCAQIADGDAVANAMNCLPALDLAGCGLAADRGRHEADAVDNAVALDEEGLAGLNILDGAALVGDLGDGGVQVNGNLVVLHSVTQVRGIGKAGSLSRNEVARVLDDDRVLAEVQQQVVGRLAGGLAAADEQNLVADVFLVLEDIGEGESFLKALDLRHRAGHGAGSDDDVVKAAERVQVVDLGAEMDFDAGLLNLTLVPSDEILVVLLEGHGGRGQEQAAQLVGLLEDDGLVAALSQNQSALHAADAAADDSDLLGLLGRDYLVAVVLHGGGVQGAAGEMQRVAQMLDVRRSGKLRHVEAAVVAADAGLDLVLLTGLDLMYPLVVDEVLTGDCNGVEPSGLDFLSGLDGIHTACADDGLVGELLDVLDVLKVAVIGHVLRRMRPVPCVVGAVVAVEHVVSGVGQILDCALGLLHVAAEFLEVLLVRHSAFAPVLGLGDDGVAQGNGEVGAAGGLYSLNYLDREAETVLEGATVLVGAVVHVGDGELVEQVALVNSVNLNAIDTGIHELLGGLGKGFDLILNLLDGHRAGLDLIVPAVRGSGSGGSDVIEVGDGGGELAEQRVLKQHYHGLGDCHGTTHTGGELNEQLCSGLVELLHVDLQILEHLVVLIQPAAADSVLDALHSGKNEAYAVLSAVEQEICGFLVKMTRLHPAEEGSAAHGTLHDAVRNLDLAYFPRGKQGIVLGIHMFLLPNNNI